MSVKITRNITTDQQLDAMIKRKSRALEVALTDEIAEIERRTIAGRDYEGADFKAYHPSYEKWKTKHPKNKGRSSRPNLNFTGKMLGAMALGKLKLTKNKISATVGFNNKRDEQKAEWNMKTREFFKLNDRQIKRVTERFRKG